MQRLSCRYVGRLAVRGGGGGVDAKVKDELAASLEGHVAGDGHHRVGHREHEENYNLRKTLRASESRLKRA